MLLQTPATQRDNIKLRCLKGQTETVHRSTGSKLQLQLECMNGYKERLLPLRKKVKPFGIVLLGTT